MSAVGRLAARGPRRGRLTRLPLGVAVLAVAVLASACVFDPGPHPASSAPPAPPTGSAAAIQAVFGPLGVADQAVAVAACESGLDPGAVSAGGTYRGLFQLGPHLAGTVAFYGGNWFDPLVNTQVARDLYLQSGWSSWPSCGR